MTAVRKRPQEPRATKAASPNERVCLFVLGMHRSGTSAIAGTLIKLGAAAPSNILGANEGNQAGHWESEPLMAFHDELLASAGSRWDDWRAFNPNWYDTPVAAQFRARAKQLLEQEFRDAPLFVFKDPRNCRLARFWLDIFAERGIAPKIVLPIRSPLEVAQSHRARDGFSLRKGLLLWLRHVLDAELASRDRPRVFVEYDFFLREWKSAVAAMEQALGTFPANTDLSAAEVDRFLSGDLRRERVSNEEFARNALVHEWVEETYAALRELTRNPGSNNARASLDHVRAHFDDASALFGGVLADAEASLGESELRFRQADHAHQEMLAQLAAAQANTEQARQDALTQLNSTQDALSATRQERDAKADEAARQAAALAEVKEGRRQALAQLASVQQDLSDKTEELNRVFSSTSWKISSILIKVENFILKRFAH